MKIQSWLWPDHNIGKRESRRLRDEHNALVNQSHKLAGALLILNGCAERGLDQSATHDGLSNGDAIARARKELEAWKESAQ